MLVVWCLMVMVHAWHYSCSHGQVQPRPRPSVTRCHVSTGQSEARARGDTGLPITCQLTWATWAGLPPFVILAEIHISRLFNPLVARLAGPSIHHLQLGCGQMQQQNKMVNTALATLVTLVTRQSHSRTIGHAHIVTWSLWGKNINSCDKRPMEVRVLRCDRRPILFFFVHLYCF